MHWCALALWVPTTDMNMIINVTTIIINPRHACAERGNYGSYSVCVHVSVCYHSNCHILGSYVENKVPLGFSWQIIFQLMICVDFVENALFKRWSPLPLIASWWALNWWKGQRSLYFKISSEISSTVCRSSDSSFESSLLTIDYQLRYLALLSLFCWSGMHVLLVYAIACNQILVVTLICVALALIAA